MPSKITLDTDSITIRRLFALNPATQGPVAEGQIAVVGQSALVGFLSTATYFSTISSATATNSVYGILASIQPGLSSISTQTGIYTSSLISTFNDLLLSSFSTLLDPAVNQPLTSTVDGLGSIGYISSINTDPDSIAVYAFSLSNDGYEANFTTSSLLMQLNGDYLPSAFSLVSTVDGLGSIGYISSVITIDANPTFSSVKGYVITLLGEQTNYTSSPLDSGNIPEIVYGSSAWLAITATGDAYLTSSLSDWTPVTSGVVAHADYDEIGGRWVAFPKYSLNGSNWTSYTTASLNTPIGNVNNVQKVLHTPDGWFIATAIQTNEGILHSFTGDDDVNWFPMAGGQVIFPYDIAYNSTTSQYMAVGLYSFGVFYSNVLVSTDGSNWAYSASNPPGNLFMRQVASDQSNTWVAWGYDLNTTSNSFFVTTDFGSSWTTAPSFDTPVSFTAYPTLKFLNGHFYFLSAGDSNQTSTIIRSTDGINWNPVSFVDIYPLHIEYADNTYVVSGIAPINSTIAVSETVDSNWVFPPPPTAVPFTVSASTTMTTRAPDAGIQVNDTFVGTPSTIQTLPNLVSTVNGLGSIGYDSTIDLIGFTQSLGSFGYISTLNKTSTLLVTESTILLNSVFQSTSLSNDTVRLFANNDEIHNVADLTSTLTNAPTDYGFLNFTSTTQGLGSAGYVSSPSLISSFLTLEPYGYITSTQFISTTVGLDAFVSSNLTTPSYLRIPPPYQSTQLFHIYMSSMTIGGTQYVSTPFDSDSSQVFSTIEIDLTGFSNLLLSNSKLTIDIPINTTFQYYDVAPQIFHHSWYLRDANGVTKGNPTTVETGEESFYTTSTIQFGSLRWQFSYGDLIIPTFSAPYTLILSTSSSLPYSTVLTMNVPSTGVIVTLNNLHR